MKNIRLIEIKRLEFAVYTSPDEKEINKNLHDLNYSKVTYLKYNSQSKGIAMRISFINQQSLFSRPQGVRRPVLLTITDDTTHKEIFTRDFHLNISKNDYRHIYHCYISFKDFPIEDNHSYCLEFVDRFKNIWLGDFKIMMHKDNHEPEFEEEDDFSTFDALLNDWIKKGKKNDAKLDSNSEEKLNFRANLDSLTGLREVKKKLSNYESMVIFNKKRNEFGLSTLPIPLHAMFLGSPGTGKTTVAKMMGEMLHQRGLLSKGHVIVKERANLLGQNYNSEGENTLKAIEEAQGGILFIDEAHQLFQSQDARDPGKFVIETLLTALSDSSKRDWMLILAGYPEQMQKMWSMNQGFKSRIPESNIYQFDDFTEEELMQIAENYLRENNYQLTEDAHRFLADRIRTDLSNKDENFGNARYVLNLIQTEIIPAMAERILSEGNDCYESLCKIEPEDIPIIFPIFYEPFFKVNVKIMLNNFRKKN